MNQIKALFVSQEISPYINSSEISDFFNVVPPDMKSKGADLRVFMPKFGVINERKNQLHEVIRLSRLNIDVNDIEQPLIIKVSSIPNTKVQVYFIDNDDLFGRKFVNHNENNQFFEDNDERAIFFCRGVIETVKKLSWIPDIIHVHGWMSSFVVPLLKSQYKNDPIFKKSKVILSIYDDFFEGFLGNEVKKNLAKLRMTQETKNILQEINHNNLLKLSIKYCDAISIGSKNIAPEILDLIFDSKKPTLSYRENNIDSNRVIDFYNNLIDA